MGYRGQYHVQDKLLFLLNTLSVEESAKSSSIMGQACQYFLQHPHVSTGWDTPLEINRRTQSHTSSLHFCNSVENGIALGIKMFHQRIESGKSAGRNVFQAGVLDAPSVYFEQGPSFGRKYPRVFLLSMGFQIEEAGKSTLLHSALDIIEGTFMIEIKSFLYRLCHACIRGLDIDLLA